MAILYMLMCCYDFIIRPTINYYEKRRYDLSEIVLIVKDLDVQSQIALINLATDKEVFPPIINEVAHVVFGGIIGIAAWSRGREKIEELRRRSSDLNNNSNNINDSENA